MHRYTVWAPAASKVKVVSDGVAHPMTASGDGWWAAEVAEATAGSRYGFSLDGGPLRPDPRSGSQPEGVDGLSALVDHAAFCWTDDGWRGLSLNGSVLYELHVGTFTAAGTFEGVIERIDHLVDLGVDAIELLPVAEFPGARGWGYDGVDLFAPHHAYGGPAGLKRLVDACHRAGLGVVLDVVYNHVGPAGNYLADFGPYFSERHRTNWGEAVNFDGPGSDEVRRFVLDNARQWLADYHFDGLRLDAVHAIADDSALHILEEMAGEVDALAAHLGRQLFLVAESDRNDPRFVRSRDAGGYGLEAAWADEWHHALHAALSGERSGYYQDFGSLELLAKALRQAWVYDGSYSRHRRRRHGRSPRGLSGQQFVVFSQNHDQVGNRAVGERSSALMTDGRLRVAAALLLTGPFTPLLFQGEEWGAKSPFQYFTDHPDPILGQAVSEGRRQEFASFGWSPEKVPDPQDEATCLASRLNWEELGQAPHAELLAWYRQLLALRRDCPELSDPRLEKVQARANEKDGTLVMERGSILVLVNLSSEPKRLLDGVVELLAASNAAVTTDSGVVVPPDAVAVVRIDAGTSPRQLLADE